MRIALDADNAGQQLKRAILEYLRALEVDITDINYSAGDDDVTYADIAIYLAQQVRDGIYDRGILICGTGLGMAMAACKVPGIFAGTCHDVYSAERLRKSNNAQIITLGERVIGVEAAKTVIHAWLGSEFAGGASTVKVDRMRALEQEILKSGQISKRGV